MIQYNSLNVKLSNSQLSKLKSAIKNEIEVFWRLSSNMVGSFNDKINLPELLLTNKQVANIFKTFVNSFSADIKLLKTQLSKMILSRGSFGRRLGLSLRTGLPLMKNLIKPLAKSVLIPLGLTTTLSAADAAMHEKKKLGSGNTTTLIISNDEMKTL